ncbi:Sec-independent protein translocase protein TatB [Rhodocyclus purpureus]|uniref:Sec-independent protein translocase protein TatB n=1 Tax=Rhodocyclus purpureus TaxID=1067 RepID=UPI001912052F|nr:Sec-independent protein translocase protein TatB [Rhodocyclus purpureus]MBK5912877.1 twin-arginine translocase subunit TatB [Rhodocyclus purpureus]
MFDIAFSELMLIAIVALIVVGPQRLPHLARTAGHLLGRVQRYVSSVKADINREMQLEELRRLQAELAESARKLETSLSSEVSGVQRSLEETRDSLNQSVATLAAAPSAGAEAVAAHDAPVSAPPAVAAALAALASSAGTSHTPAAADATVSADKPKA